MKKEYNVIWIDDEWRKQLEFKEECEELRALKKSSRYEDFSIINKKADCT